MAVSQWPRSCCRPCVVFFVFTSAWWRGDIDSISRRDGGGTAATTSTVDGGPSTASGSSRSTVAFLRRRGVEARIERGEASTASRRHAVEPMEQAKPKRGRRNRTRRGSPSSRGRGRRQLGHLRDAARVVGHRAVAVDRQARRERREHAERGERDTVQIREREGEVDDGRQRVHGHDGRAVAEGQAVDQVDGRALLADVRASSDGLVREGRVVLGHEADEQTTESAHGHEIAAPVEDALIVPLDHGRQLELVRQQRVGQTLPQARRGRSWR